MLVALRDLPPGEVLHFGEHDIVLQEPVPAKHKMAITSLKTGDPVYMYGVLVGRATRNIPSGGLISTENLKHDAGVFGKRQLEYQWQPPNTDKFRDRTFMGYHRADGQVGVRNYWLVIPLVFCE
ncbi:MAG: SAF domain-containing protein, partial [Bacteroidota bacterium]